MAVCDGRNTGEEEKRRREDEMDGYNRCGDMVR
jgi:hypothetical protein